eukprot:4634372-Amphidinium_carterae.1
MLATQNYVRLRHGRYVCCERTDEFAWLAGKAPFSLAFKSDGAGVLTDVDGKHHWLAERLCHLVFIVDGEERLHTRASAQSATWESKLLLADARAATLPDTLVEIDIAPLRQTKFHLHRRLKPHKGLSVYVNMAE